MQDTLDARYGSLVPVGAPCVEWVQARNFRGFPRKDRFQKAERRATRMRIF